jgi:hypothetical protein
MRTRYLLSGLLLACGSTTAFAQTTTTGTTGTTTTGPTITGLNSSSSNGSDFSIQQTQTAPPIAGITSTGANLQGSNALGQYYANPYYQGRAGSSGTDNPGGFGTALYGTSTAGARGTTGATRTGATGALGTTARTAGTGGTTGTSAITGFGNTGLGGTNTAGRTAGGLGTAAAGLGNRTTGARAGGLGTNQGQSSSTVIALPRQISYTATLRMPAAPALNTAQVQSELRSVLDRSSMLTNGRGVEVTMSGNTVVLRGQVKNEEEAQTAEGIIRLTPGVKDVKNELKY